MANRRMFAKTIIDSDAFLDMPLSTQSLYFHLSMRADDDGFINSPKKIARMIGASQDELKILYDKKFILGFENGVVVIKHWKIHNYLRKDRYTATIYKDEKELLFEKENGIYTFNKPKLLECQPLGLPVGIPDDIPLGNQMDTQVRLGKDRLGKDKNKPKKIDPKTDAYTKEFEELYKLYPRAKAKRQTFINYCGRLKAYSHEELFNCVKVYKIQVENSKSFNYSSNNFFGTKAYFEDFLNIKVEDAKPIIDIDDDKGRGHLLGAVCNTGKITRRPKRFEDVVVDD